MKNYLPAIILILSIISCSCDSTEPPKIGQNIELTEIDASVTESYLHVKINSTSPSRELILLRDGNEIIRFSSISSDTIITDTTLTELTSYNYKAQLVENGTVVGESSTITIKTLQPSSRNFTWQTYTFGEGSSSIISDVAIIDENNIWAVGEINHLDSLGNPDPNIYNALQWNGMGWNEQRITVDFRGNLITLPLEGITTFTETSIWCVGSLPIQRINDNWVIHDLRSTLNPELSLSKVWGKSESNLYFIGRGGNLVHYDGTTWQKLESGTETSITDIWGIINPVNNKEEIYCAVSNFFEPKDKKILKITDTDKVEDYKWDVGRRVRTVWTNKGYPIFAGGDGFFENKTGEWKEINLGVNYSTSIIRGTALNNVFAVGGFGLVAHYNGTAWKLIEELHLNNGNYTSLAMNEGTIAITGFNGNKGIIVIGRQN